MLSAIMLASTAGAVRWLPSTAVACCSTLFGYAVMLGVGCDAGLVDSISLFTYRLDPRIGPLHRETAWLGVGLRADCLTHVLPRCLPTPTEEADGNGYGVITGRGGPSRRAAAQRVSVNLVPRCCGPAFDSIRPRADRQEHLPMFRCPGLPGFP